MTNLITAPQFTDNELKAIQSLPSIQQPFILAIMDSKIATMEKVNAGNSIYEIIKITELDSGIGKYLNDDLLLLAKSVYDLIVDRYSSLTITEFKLACKYGVIGTYGEWQGLCLKTFNQFIKGYLTGEKVQAIKDWNAKVDKQLTSDKPITDSIKFDKESSIKAFEHFKLTQEMPMACFAYYDIINELIGVEFEGKKTLVPDQAVRKRIVKETSVLFNSLVNQERKKFSKEENLMDIIIDTKGMKGFERMLKREFLKHYFNQLIEEGKQLEL